MNRLATTSSRPTTRSSRLRVAARWMVTFVGFPLGGLIAELVAGPVDSIIAALVGGMITGVFIGAAQWWGLGSSVRRPAPIPWIAATAIGFMVGLGVGEP